MRRVLSVFVLSESGAVTVDWVVIAAGAISITFGTMVVIGGAYEETGGTIEDLVVTNPLEGTFSQ